MLLVGGATSYCLLMFTELQNYETAEDREEDEARELLRS